MRVKKGITGREIGQRRERRSDGIGGEEGRGKRDGRREEGEGGGSRWSEGPRLR